MRTWKATRFALATAATVALTVALPTLAQRGDDAGRVSKNGRTEGTIGGVTVTVEYGRPNVKGRTIWGGLVPYGQVWRAGADEATTIAFDQSVTVEGKPLAAGTYGLFTIPGEKAWTVIFNKTAKQWGAFKYEAAQDALRVEVAPRPHGFTETLTFEIAGDEVVLSWDKLAVPFRLAAAK
jgi:Protein of unknown function (DUF2911)